MLPVNWKLGKASATKTNLFPNKVSLFCLNPSPSSFEVDAFFFFFFEVDAWKPPLPLQELTEVYQQLGGRRLRRGKERERGG